ncbi:MAG: hypothetical protein QNK33_08475 [Bacteroidales bacterium]|nr:hypothetical protein [Bacteroidales bacterium]
MFNRLKYKIQYRLTAYSQYGRRKANKYAGSTKDLINKAVDGVGEEAKETEEMANSFFRLLGHKLNLDTRKDPPSEEEVKEAIEQLKDLGRFSVFATISIIPGGGFSLIGLEVLARKFGVKNFTFVPSAFRKKQKTTDLKSTKE